MQVRREEFRGPGGVGEYQLTSEIRRRGIGLLYFKEEAEEA